MLKILSKTSIIPFFNSPCRLNISLLPQEKEKECEASKEKEKEETKEDKEDEKENDEKKQEFSKENPSTIRKSGKY